MDKALMWYFKSDYEDLDQISSLRNLKWINFDPVLGYTSPGIQYYHVSKIKQYGWLIFDILCCEQTEVLMWSWNTRIPVEADHS